VMEGKGFAEMKWSALVSPPETLVIFQDGVPGVTRVQTDRFGEPKNGRCLLMSLWS
jgi:hypothetical protein